MTVPEGTGPGDTGGDSTGSAPTGPLAGIRVIELAHVMAGPVCGLMLADLGADVIKVERIDGDPARHYVPPSLGGESAAFMMMNRNKRGIAVDLKAPGGRALALRLLRGADVAVENYRRGTLERLGLGWEVLHQENPGLVLCEISGYGRTGPLADLGGFDLIAQGAAGIMSLTGEGPGRPPVKCGVPLTDITAGILGALGTVAALWRRQRTGEGQRVDTSLYEAGITQTFWQSAIALATGVSPGAMGSAHPLTAPYQAFPTANGWINVGTSTQGAWERLPGAVQLPELADDERYRDNAGRLAHREELCAVLEERFRTRTTAEWLERLADAGIPAGPVASVGEMLDHPQTRAREMVTRVEHATAGTMETLGLPIKLGATPGSVRRAAPVLGQHTREVLAEIGHGDDEIDALVEAGIVRTWEPEPRS